MTDRPRLQPLVRARVAALGEAGDAWHASLAHVVAELAERWQLEVGRPLGGGSASYVVGARDLDGRPCVVKILVPDQDRADEAAVLGPADGRGYVRLLGHAPDHDALLLERLGPSLDRRPRPPDETLRILAGTLREAWTLPLDLAPDVAAGADKASSLHRSVTELAQRLDGAVSPAALRLALDYAERRAAAFDPAACVVVHGDAHPANALPVLAPRPGAPTGHVFVDPCGFRADPAYDLGVAVRDWCSKLRGPDARDVLEGYCSILADETGCDEQAIWEWGFLERVSTGLYVTGFGAAAVGRPFLETADRLTCWR